MKVIVIKKNQIIDILIWCILFLQIMCFTWLDITKYVRWIIILLLGAYFCLNSKRIFKAPLLWLVSLYVYSVLNFLICGGSIGVLFNNMMRILPQILIIMYATYIMQYKKKYVINILKSKLVFCCINIYMIVNIPVLIMEMQGHFWLSGRSTAINTYVPDLMSGLFGFNGTPLLAIFSAFFFIYNINYYFYFIKKCKVLFLFYNLLMLIFYVYISTLNDNKGFYLILVMFAGLYYLVSLIKRERNKHILVSAFRILWKILPFCVIVIVIGTLLYKYTPVKEVFNLIIVKVSEGLQYGSVRGGGERFGIIFYALFGGLNRFFGFGIGRHYWVEENAFGYFHYGISDMGTFWCLGGLIFVILISTFLYSCFKKIFNGCFVPLCMMLLYWILLIYTQVLTIPSATISVMLFEMVCMSRRYIIENDDWRVIR